MESIIKDHMLFLSQHNLISKQQHGFLVRKSTCIQLIECINDRSFSLKLSKLCYCIFIDFSKAFDYVLDDKLCNEFFSCGFSGKLLSWIHAFLHASTSRLRFGSCLYKI